jgi:two-component system, cell cycle response regulator DivK
MLLKNKRIFIVEDNLENRAIAQIMLEYEGAKTAIDRWGVDTVARLRAFAPVDLILLDLMFPYEVSGYDVFDQIRAEDDLKAIPIVAVSAADPSQAIPKTQSKGFAGFISKPLDGNTFVPRLLQILNEEFMWVSV